MSLSDARLATGPHRLINCNEVRMRETLATAAVAATVIVASLMLGDRAEAIVSTPSALSAAAANAALLRQAAVVCSYNGCARVHTSRAQPHRPRP
jgi:hypothetical protein